MPNTIIQFKQVNFSYDNFLVLKDINFKVNLGDFLAIIGPNGGGKTTILKLMLGLLKPKSGQIKVFGQAPEKAREQIGYVPQYFEFDSNFPIKVLEVVLMGRLRRSILGYRYLKEDLQIAREALDTVGLKDLEKRQIGQLSGGQRQRVLIARALASQPKLLLLDEPVSSIDQPWQQSFYQLLEKLKKDITIILVTHDISLISSHVDQMACVNQELFYHGSTDKGLDQVAKMYKCPVKLLLHDTPHIHVKH